MLRRKRAYKANYSQEDIEKALKEVVELQKSVNAAAKKYSIPLGTLQNRYHGLHGKHIGRPCVFTKNEEKLFITGLTTVAKWGYPFTYTDVKIYVKGYL